MQARSECKVEKVFESLKKEVEEDLNKFCRCNHERSGWLDFAYLGHRRTFGVKYKTSEYGVYFILSGNKIEVEEYTAKGGTDSIMTLSVKLNDEGECRLVDEKKCEWLRSWQVRQRALEGTFFGTG